MATKGGEIRRYGEVEPKSLEQRYLTFGRAAMDRFTLEMSKGGENLSYDRLIDADVLQVEKPVSGYSGERWQVTVARYGPEVLVEQLYYSPAAKTWMTGVSFLFDQEVLAGRLYINEIRNHPGLLEDDDFFTGVCEAIERWNASVDQVSPIEEDLEKLDLV